MFSRCTGAGWHVQVIFIYFIFSLSSTFAAQHLQEMSHTHLLQYDTLINTPSNDWLIYYWITGKEAIPIEYDNDVMKMLQKHVKNEKREQRYQQPDLKLPIGTEH